MLNRTNQNNKITLQQIALTNAYNFNHQIFNLKEIATLKAVSKNLNETIPGKKKMFLNF